MCFLPGTLALGAVNGLDARDMDLAKVRSADPLDIPFSVFPYRFYVPLLPSPRICSYLCQELLNTCHEMYSQMPTHLAAEIVHFHVPGDGMDDVLLATLYS